MFRLDYLSCFLTVVSTILVARKSWSGLALAGINSAVICMIGLRTAQFGFIPANLFCIAIYAMSIRSWSRKPSEGPEQERTNLFVAPRPLAPAPIRARSFVAARRLGAKTARGPNTGIHLVYRASVQTGRQTIASSQPEQPLQQTGSLSD